MTNTNPTNPDKPKKTIGLRDLNWIPTGHPGEPSSSWRCPLDDGRSASLSSARRNDGVIVWEVLIFDSRKEYGYQLTRCGEFLTSLQAKKDLVRRLNAGE